jgi:hypothetical protein
METTVANSSYFDRMEHSSTMGSSGVSRDINFQNPLEGDPDFAAYTMSSNYKQTPMMLSSSSMLGSGEEPFHYEFGERIGAMLGMETMFDGNLNSSVSQGDWWSDLEQISSQSTLVRQYLSRSSILVSTGLACYHSPLSFILPNYIYPLTES